MYIRPYTVSQTSLLLLTLFLSFYLQSALHRMPPEKRPHTRWMIRATIWNAVSVALNMIIGVVEAPRLDLLAYLRDPVGLLIFHAITQAVYAIPPVESFARRQEARRTTQAAALLLSVEMIYFLYRLWSFGQTGVIQPKHPLLLLPLPVAGLWVLLLVARKNWASAYVPAVSTGQPLDRIPDAPQHGLVRFYQALFVVVTITLVGVFAFYVMMRATVPAPTWLPVTADTVVTVSFLTMLFAYLRSPLAATTLEIRLMGAGLVIFLGLISVLGWLITLTYLNHQAPDVYPSLVFGNQMQAQFFITPAAHRPLAQMLNNLLAPLVGFAVVGSFVFARLYTMYYRSTFNESLVQIFEGFRQVQQGNLAHRLPVLTWQDEFSRIGIAFNQMVMSLEQANQVLHVYQQHLQDLVHEGTAELSREMELRSQLELHYAVQDERSRIAQETHDGLLQSLMGVRIRLNRGKRISRVDAATIEAEMAELADEVTLAMQELRSLINELNEEILPHGLVAGIEEAVARHRQTYPTTVHTDLSYAPDHLTLGQELHILRIVQEALANASRHGTATHVEVVLGLTELDEGPGALHLQIRDNGSGFDPTRYHGNGFGLHNMRRRAASLGAVLEIQSRPRDGFSGGTVISLRLASRANLKKLLDPDSYSAPESFSKNLPEKQQLSGNSW
jgi:signal transduction histidine kinase